MNYTNFTLNEYDIYNPSGQVDSMKVINSLCKFEKESLYYGNIKYLMFLTIVFIGFKIISKMIGRAINKDYYYFGFNKFGIYINSFNVLKTVEDSIKPIAKFFLGTDVMYLNEGLEKTLLLIFIFKLVYINCQVFGTLPFGISCI